MQALRYTVNKITSAEERFAVFQRSTPGYHIFLSFSVLIGTVPLLTSDVRAARKDEPQASGFYGPGVVTAWLLTALWMIGTGELYPVLMYILHWLSTKRKKPPILPPPIAAEEETTANADSEPIQLVGVDVALASVIFYPAVAATDCLIQARHHSGVPTAAEDVCRLGMFVSWFAIWTASNTPGFVHARFPVWSSTPRMWTWHAIHAVCFIVYYTATMSIRGVTTSEWVAFWVMLFLHVYTFSKEVAVICLALRMRHPNKATRRLPVRPLTHWVIFQTMGLIFQQFESEKGFKTRFAWPRSASRFADLDQWTALAAAVLLVTWPYIDACLQQLSRSVWNWLKEHGTEKRRATAATSLLAAPPPPPPPSLVATTKRPNLPPASVTIRDEDLRPSLTSRALSQ